MFFQLSGLFAFLFLNILPFLFFYRANEAGSSPSFKSETQKIWMLFVAYAFILSLASLKPSYSMIYSLALGVTLVAASISGGRPPCEHVRLFGRLSVALLFCLLVLLFSLGMHGRTIGWIPPNNVGKIAFVGLVFALTSSQKFKFLIAFAHISFIFLVNSRVMIISSVLFLAVYFWRSGRGGKIYLALLAFMSTNFAVFLTLVEVSLMKPLTIIVLISSVLALDDADRGVSSGFTGRTGYWEAGMQLIADSPFFGYGFRTREATDAVDEALRSAHSGWLNLIIDNGILGAAILILIFVLTAYQSAKMRYSKDLAVKKIGSGAFAFFFTAPFFWSIEPTYLNFGVIDIVPFVIFSGIIFTIKPE